MRAKRSFRSSSGIFANAPLVGANTVKFPSPEKGIFTEKVVFYIKKLQPVEVEEIFVTV